MRNRAADEAFGGAWNHNIQYFDLLLTAAPRGGVSALDVGCGDGALTRRLPRVIPDVVGIDIAPASISLARQRHSARAIDFVRGDFLTYPFRDCSFDLITCSAAMHHMPLKRALRRMADLLRPGGVLAILGLARSSYPLDLPRDAVAVAVNRVFLVMRGYWDSPAPAVPPRAPSYREIRAVAAELLPGHRFRRHLLWRYSIIWTKPPGVASA